MKTLWRDKEAKYKPINKAAALICRKARPEHMPPPEPEQLGPYITNAQRLIIAYRIEQAEKILAVENEIRLSDERKRVRTKIQQPQKSKADQVNFGILRKRFETYMLKLAKKSRLPRPTSENIKRAWLALPQKR